ncbi:1-(5-phosphoribosyl)-5-[(5-phosphoribosylamino)methylideneamino]imidazole-4-carboxamide isomerase [Streptococcus cristatus]|uniref:1-(5-phosphoribosyl)-5-[(5- phosphoribosylamino)methylideneamino]imidazole-4- carboxamide isomerase n=1 Tax=Streptococcus cristatus TaxID=45634 RepID=UPI002283ABC3|nr:1-(5-phosphoribosyl)-5-[(5-phosphoribosylamino)methylideneamino]imidazole-4-carboxamide isomerase [Streptococcus cristatus]MCY7216679.1 1-(5-phosphoribosyl)-5-[(5-phosphoribosylamino)methylideneamino]imidazole-4-carboxamide isomerase [Streptococcus cristatus]
MRILPAIDIKDGQAVRLFKGDFSQKTVVNPDVLAQALLFKEAGIYMIHVVDLDGALEGRAANRDLIARIKAETGLAIQVGGGIRSLEQIEDYLAVGIDRVIIGSMAVKNPAFVEAALQRFGSDKIVVGIDAKKGLVATEGWLETSDQDYVSLALAMEKIGVRLFVYTDVDRDGTLTGPNIQHYQKLLVALKQAKVIASGGIQSAADLEELRKLGLTGAIVGKAYYQGNISLSQLKEIDED